MQPSETSAGSAGDQHVDADTLALLALGEVAGGGRDADHLGCCPRCQSELDELKAVVHAGRTTTSADQPQTPSDAVWDRIVADLAGEPAIAARSAGGHASEHARHAAVVPLRPRRSRPVALLVAAATAGVLVGATATWFATRDDAPTQQVVAGVQLDPLPDSPDGGRAAGEATVVQTGANRAVEVAVQGLEDDGVFYQVWLIDTATERLISLGVLDADHVGTFQVPAGVDLEQFPIVDVSAEPYDGDPTHSGASVVRGSLPA